MVGIALKLSTLIRYFGIIRFRFRSIGQVRLDLLLFLAPFQRNLKLINFDLIFISNDDCLHFSDMLHIVAEPACYEEGQLTHVILTNFVLMLI